jgi:hypothetical protein
MRYLSFQQMTTLGQNFIPKDQMTLLNGGCNDILSNKYVFNQIDTKLQMKTTIYDYQNTIQYF